MRHALDAAVAVVLLAVAVAVAANAISLKAAAYSQAEKIASSERQAIAKSEFALSHCPPKGIAYCRGGVVLVNQVESLPKETGGVCVSRLVLWRARVEAAVFCS